MDKDTAAYCQHLAEMEAEHVADDDDAASVWTNPEDISDLSLAAYGCFEDSFDFIRASMAGKKRKAEREAAEA
eukprot:1967400-Karenia_brevis.AAC.1